jgi:hypothetical protein
VEFGHLGKILLGYIWVAGRFSNHHKRYIREEDNKSNKQVMASSGWFYVLISKYITGTDGRSVRVLTVTRPLTRGMQ